MELDWSNAEYVPLPPSPDPEYEEDDWQRACRDPVLRRILYAGLGGHHARLIRLAAALSPRQRQGAVGESVAQAYRALIIRNMRLSRLATAAKQCLTMFAQVPSEVEELDKRRYNRILAKLNKVGTKHEFKPIKAAKPPTPLPFFTISDSSGWSLEDVRKLHENERPGYRFDIVSLDAAGTWLLASWGLDRDRPEPFLRRMNRSGKLVAEKILSHDVYRTGSGISESSFAIMDSSGTLYIYDTALNLVARTRLRRDPRLREHFGTMDTSLYWGDFKSQLRAVDVGPEGERYLFTLADEIWCCTLQGRTVWGLSMPLKEGWKRVVGRRGRFAVGRDVDDALRLLGLCLPVGFADIKRKYHTLALAHHPDRNRGSRQAAEKMKALNLAFEVLTGVTPGVLELQGTGITCYAHLDSDSDWHEGFIESPLNWIYAASFAAKDGSVYIATHSGRVILVSREGRALAIYDLGSWPSDIIETGCYTYFRTTSRLYVIVDRNKLAAFVNVLNEGRLIVGQSGFGLLSSYELRWFTIEGKKVGTLATRDVIRAVHDTNSGMIVNTWKHQAQVRGLLV